MPSKKPPPPSKAPSVPNPPPVPRISPFGKKGPAPTRRETMEVDVSWLEQEAPPSAGRRPSRAPQSPSKAPRATQPPSSSRSTKPPASRSTKPPASRSTKPPSSRSTSPPASIGPSRRPTMEVQLEWLEEEQAPKSARPKSMRPKAKRVMPPPLPPQAPNPNLKVRKHPPPLPREEPPDSKRDGARRSRKPPAK